MLGAGRRTAAFGLVLLLGELRRMLELPEKQARRRNPEAIMYILWPRVTVDLGETMFASFVLVAMANAAMSAQRCDAAPRCAELNTEEA